MKANAPSLLTDAQWLAHRYVEQSDSFRFIRVPRADHAGTPFLTDDCLGQRQPGGDLPAEICLTLPSDARLGFIFHSAFCGSTLLTRALSCPDIAMGLSEPVLLNDLVGFRRRGADPRAVARMADLSTRLLARPFGPDETTIIKPSNVVNPLAELLLAMRPGANAIFLYAPLETFLVSVARKGLACRLWVRELLIGYLRDGFVSLGFEPEDHFLQTDLQIAAVGWLAQHAHFQQLAGRFGPGRIRSLNADLLNAQPAEGLAAATAHLRISLNDSEIAKIVSGPTFTRHSKFGQSFTPERRAEEYAAARMAHQEEIDRVVDWAMQVAQGANISMAGPFPLLDQV